MHQKKSKNIMEKF